MREAAIAAGSRLRSDSPRGVAHARSVRRWRRSARCRQTCAATVVPGGSRMTTACRTDAGSSRSAPLHSGDLGLELVLARARRRRSRRRCWRRRRADAGAIGDEPQHPPPEARAFALLGRGDQRHRGRERASGRLIEMPRQPRARAKTFRPARQCAAWLSPRARTSSKRRGRILELAEVQQAGCADRQAGLARLQRRVAEARHDDVRQALVDEGASSLGPPRRSTAAGQRDRAERTAPPPESDRGERCAASPVSVQPGDERKRDGPSASHAGAVNVARTSAHRGVRRASQRSHAGDAERDRVAAGRADPRARDRRTAVVELQADAAPAAGPQVLRRPRAGGRHAEHHLDPALAERDAAEIQRAGPALEPIGVRGGSNSADGRAASSANAARGASASTRNRSHQRDDPHGRATLPPIGVRKRARVAPRGAPASYLAGMKANRGYRLLHTRANRRPARLDPTRIDHIEVVEVASGEVVLFWDLAGARRRPPRPPPARGSQRARGRRVHRPLVRDRPRRRSTRSTARRLDAPGSVLAAGHGEARRRGRP